MTNTKKPRQLVEQSRGVADENLRAVADMAQSSETPGIPAILTVEALARAGHARRHTDTLFSLTPEGAEQLRANQAARADYLRSHHDAAAAELAAAHKRGV